MYEYPGVPPEGLMVAVPLLLPLQETGVEAVVAFRDAGWAIVTEAFVLQPWASVTLTV